MIFAWTIRGFTTERKWQRLWDDILNQFANANPGAGFHISEVFVHANYMSKDSGSDRKSNKP